MKTTIFAILALLAMSSQACDQLYAKAGAGYKFDEHDRISFNGHTYKLRHRDPYSARLEAGCRKGSWTIGVSHHSQWRSGWPSNDRGEPYKTEFFVDYEWTWDIGG